MTISTRIATAIFASAILAFVLAQSAFAETTVVVSGNGSNSDSDVHVNKSTDHSYDQDNSTNVTNEVDVTLKTGGNKANGNTGGDVDIRTGSAEATTQVWVEGGVNVLEKDDCGCPDEDVTIHVKDNGKNSDNDVRYRKNDDTSYSQDNNTRLRNTVWHYLKTGKNRANDNTDGSVNVRTGRTSSFVDIFLRANRNVVR